MIGKVTYNSDGLPKCEICGKCFNRIGLHLHHTHHITVRQYKKDFGLDFSQSLCSKKSSLKSRKSVMRNYDQCIRENLIVKNRNKFTKGCHTGKYLSIQSRKRITRQIAHTWRRPAWFDVAMKKNMVSLRKMLIHSSIYDEDVFQDTLEGALKRWYEWDKNCKLTTWLFGRYKNLRLQKLDNIPLYIEELKSKPEEIAYLETDSDVITVNLGTLTKPERKFVELLADGKQVYEIAEILGNTPESVKSYKSKLLGKLQEQYSLVYNHKAEIRKAKEFIKHNTVELLSECDRIALTFQLN